MKRLYIRVDTNEVIATGHVMRCLSIAEAARDEEIETTFILADDHATKLLDSKGYEYIVLNTKWDDLDNEIEKIAEVIKRERIEKLLIDTYQVTEKYLRALTEITYTIYLDDLCSFIYPVNAIICYANYYKNFEYERIYSLAVEEGIIKSVPKFYLGCQFVPLRKEFSKVLTKKIDKKISNILILSGGTDPYDALLYILDTIDTNKYENINVICGHYYNKKSELEKKYREKQGIHIYNSVSSIIEFMQEADLVISAGGTTLYEICATGTPTISYSFADNQLENVLQFDRDNIIKYAGDIREVRINIEEIIEYLEDDVKRKECSKLMQQLVDGKGAYRIINKIIC